MAYLNNIDSWMFGSDVPKIKLSFDATWTFQNFLTFSVCNGSDPLVIQVMFSTDDYAKMAEQGWSDLRVVFTIFTSQLQMPFQSLFI